jgi:ribosomal protein S18 acetylase RimI-like enzyme
MVRLVPMSPDEFDGFLGKLIREYAADHVAAGRWTADVAEAEARKEIERLLPTGLATPNHLLYSILADPADEKVGVAWFAIEPRGAFIYYIEIFEAHRRRGYAEQALRQLEAIAVERGATKTLLHVFGSNTAARKLYSKLGYEETNVLMAKGLGSRPAPQG